MLNIIKLNSNKKKISFQEKKSLKHFPSPVRAWNNSIYVFNKNVLNLIPASSKFVINLIKNYFNAFNKIVEQKIRMKKILLKLRRMSLNKIYISNGEFKHTNNKLIITLYIFNRQKRSYLIFLRKWYVKLFLKKKGLKQRERNFEKFLYRLFKSLSKKGLTMFNNINNNKLLENSNKFRSKQISIFINNFQEKLLSKWLSKLLLYFYYKQLIYINKSKLNYTYLQYLKKCLENIYNKNVEFNFIDIKRFYLNSDILSKSITMKIKKNRRSMAKYTNFLKNKIKTQTNTINLNEPTYNYIVDNNNLTPYESINIINNLKYKHISGFRIEASGRLTRRYTASRSVNRTVYKGNLLNIDSSYKGLSAIMLKGNLESNLQYTKLSSKTRIGSFGIKGWVSGN